MVQGLKVKVAVELLDHLHLGVIPVAVVLLKDGLLLGRSDVMVCVAEEPAALFVLDVGADLADLLRSAVAVQVVVLRLEVDAHHHEHLARGVVRLAVFDAEDDHRERDRRIERVEGSLILDDKSPPLNTEVLEGEVHAQGVEQLAALRLEGCLEEQVE
eukprot:CAMPEP_0205947154 /NCGR_PEP_ID=MMETSP1325-20131115/69418_1 /ASSEMBLY_ACC=CAM_ASM_000708 /TAXON_ID=236786 /ORGANISM="Florenciella sp., Strain RCC1007" /LENGTH=157 /DNA_ID=CAMNT_0053318255 /DNA_START=861 /DNA_END=1334 /DNA_ORIENTATION=-